MRPRSILTRTAARIVGMISGRLGRRREASGEAAAIVMLGDSLTQDGHWDRFFPDIRIRNCGVGGDTTQDIANRLDSVIVLRPRQLFLLVGINDLNAGRTLEEIAADYEAIVSRLQQRLPATETFVQTVLPVTAQWASIGNADIAALNACLEGLAHRRGLSVVNLHAHFVDSRGELRAELSRDGLHLNRRGYRRWCAIIDPLVSAGL